MNIASNCSINRTSAACESPSAIRRTGRRQFISMETALSASQYSSSFAMRLKVVVGPLPLRCAGAVASYGRSGTRPSIQSDQSHA